MLKNKILLVLAAILLCAQGAVAGGNPRKSGINGIVFPVFDAASRAAGAFYSWGAEQDGAAGAPGGDDDEGEADHNSEWAPSSRKDTLYYSDDDGDEESIATEVKNEASEADEILGAGARETLRPMKQGGVGIGLIIEVFRDIGEEIHPDFANKVLEFFMNDETPMEYCLALVEAIGDMLPSTRRVDRDELTRLLDTLVGKNGHGGLVRDGKWLMRWVAVRAIERIFHLRTADPDERMRLLGALVGRDGHAGLCADENFYIRRAVASAIGAMLASGTPHVGGESEWREADAYERTQLFGALIENNGLFDALLLVLKDGTMFRENRLGIIKAIGAMLASGMPDLTPSPDERGRLVGTLVDLSGDKDPWVRCALAKAIGAILAMGTPDLDEHGRFVGTLIELSGDKHPWVRCAVAKAIGANILSGAPDLDECRWLVGVLIGFIEGAGDIDFFGVGEPDVREYAVRAIKRIFVSDKADPDERTRLLDGLIKASGDPHFRVRITATESIRIILTRHKCHADERRRLIDELIGEDGHSRLLADRDDVKEVAVDAMGAILSTDMPEADERTRLWGALIGASKDQNRGIRKATVKAIGGILASGMADADESTQLRGALIELGSDPDWNVRVAVAGAIKDILTSSRAEAGLCKRLVDVLVEGVVVYGGFLEFKDPNRRVQDAFAEAIVIVALRPHNLEKEQCVWFRDLLWLVEQRRYGRVRMGWQFG